MQFNQSPQQSNNAPQQQRPMPRNSHGSDNRYNSNGGKPQQQNNAPQQQRQQNNNGGGYNQQQQESRQYAPQKQGSKQFNNNQSRNDQPMQHRPEQQNKPANNSSQSYQQNNSQQHGGRQNQQQGSNDDRSFMNVKSHGKNNAIEVAPDETQKGWHTIRLEGAPKMQGGSKAYDWGKKVSIQITKNELPVIIGVLLGYLPYCEYKNHGGDANKWFSMENQGKSFYFKVGQASTKQMMPCPVPTVEAHLMGMLALTQYIKNFEGMSSGAALEAIKVMSGHMVRNDQIPKPNNSR